MAASFPSARHPCPFDRPTLVRVNSLEDGNSPSFKIARRQDASRRAAGTQAGMEIASVGGIPMGMTKAEVSHLVVVQPAQARLKPAEMHPI